MPRAYLYSLGEIRDGLVILAFSNIGNGLNIPTIRYQVNENIKELDEIFDEIVQVMNNKTYQPELDCTNMNITGDMRKTFSTFYYVLKKDESIKDDHKFEFYLHLYNRFESEIIIGNEILMLPTLVS
jgi:hypothetical protein